MKKILMIQPPQWCPTTPHLAVPLLRAQLDAAGFQTTIIDLNIKFFNAVLKSDVIDTAAEAARRDFKALEKIYRNTPHALNPSEATYEQKVSYLKYETLKDFFTEHSEDVAVTIEKIDEAVRAMKSPERFYEPETLWHAKHTVQTALRIVSLPYAPNELGLYNFYMHPAFGLGWDSIKAQAQDKRVNMFYDFLQDYAQRFAAQDYDVICISFTDLSQMVCVFTLARLLKQVTKAHIVAGGNYATQISEDMLEHDEIFKEYIDYLSIGNGETALPDLCRALAQNTPPEQVPNLVFYAKDKKKIINTGFSCAQFQLDNLAFPDFSGYDFHDYLSPDAVIPVELSKGCYWGKCTFCDYAYGHQQYAPKQIPRIVKELKYYVKQGFSKFVFVDECIPPKFYNNLATAIIEAGLKIYYYSFARLENGFTKAVLKNLYNSGARLFLWGYECASPRVMKLINKGIDIDNRLKILQDSREAGIWNNGLFLLGYPTETMEEIQQTIAVAYRHRREIPSCSFSDFKMKKHSKISEEVGNNGVYSLAGVGELFANYQDEIDGPNPAQRRALRRNLQFDFLDKNAHSLWAVVSSDFDHLLLYLAKYGCDYVSGYRSKERIAPEFR